MSRAELQQAAAIRSQEAVQWAPYHAPDEEESEIVAQFLTAPYPCFDGYDYPDVSLGINTLSYCGSASSSIDLNLSGEEEEHRIPKGAAMVPGPSAANHIHAGYINDDNGHGAATPKRKVFQAGQDDQEEDLGWRKKKPRAADHKGKKFLPRTCSSSSSSYCSDNESNCSRGNSGGAEDHVAGGRAKPKARAGRGSRVAGRRPILRASMQRRREKINDKLRALQKLVPNGTKVDLSTMLEEAVLYVKFLQLQIKVLNSDETWMYAPLAYNGMSLGIDLRITPQ